MQRAQVERALRERRELEPEVDLPPGYRDPPRRRASGCPCHHPRAPRRPRARARRAPRRHGEAARHRPSRRRRPAERYLWQRATARARVRGSIDLRPGRIRDRRATQVHRSIHRRRHFVARTPGTWPAFVRMRVSKRPAISVSRACRNPPTSEPFASRSASPAARTALEARHRPRLPSRRPHPSPPRPPRTHRLTRRRSCLRPRQAKTRARHGRPANPRLHHRPIAFPGWSPNLRAHRA